MAVGRHRQQVDAALFREAYELGRWIAHRQLGGDFQSTGREIGGELRQVITVVFHLFRFTQLQLVEIARSPSIGDVHEVQLRADLHGELTYVLEDRLVGRRVFDGNENAAVHGYASVWYSSHTLSAAMITATVHASAFIHSGATNSPIFARSEVNMTSGNTAKGS
jgi:hypothetical protein